MWNISSANPATPEVAIYSCGGVAPQSVPAAPRPNQGDKVLTSIILSIILSMILSIILSILLSMILSVILSIILSMILS